MIKFIKKKLKVIKLQNYESWIVKFTEIKLRDKVHMKI